MTDTSRHQDLTVTTHPLGLPAPDRGARPDDVTAPSQVVVTGAGGWLGRNLVQSLAPVREKVRCLVFDAEEGPALELLDESVEIVAGDVRDPVVLDELFDGLDRPTIVHALGVVHADKTTKHFFDVNVGGTQAVLDRARRIDAHRMIYISSNSPFGANPTPDDRFIDTSAMNPYLQYGASKAEAEDIVTRAHDRGDVATVILRPPWFYGPFQPERQSQWFSAVRKGRFPLIGDGTNRRSMAFTGNIVHGVLRAEVAAGAVGRPFWIADSEAYAMRDVLATVRRALEAEGLEVTGRQLRVPRAVGVFAEWVDRALQSRDRYVQPVHVLGELKDTIACDIGASTEVLGYDPEISLFDGMRISIRWCIERGMSL